MATVSRENIGKLTDKLTVHIPKGDYLPAFEQSLKKYAKSANIPGFRKGLVPSGMIKKMYGKSVFAEEVLRGVEKNLNEYMRSENLEILGRPLPLTSDEARLDMDNPTDYSFSFEVGLKPAVSIDPASITVTRHKVNVTDTMVDEEVDKLKLRHGKMTDPEEVTSEDNVLNVTFLQSDVEGNETEGGINKGNSLLVKYFDENFRNQLMGKKKDDAVILQLNSAFGQKEREWIIEDLGLKKDDESAGELYFKMTITKVGLVKRPEMNEEFFMQAFPGKEITTEEAFRQAVRDDIQSQWDVQSRHQLHDQIYHHLVDHIQIEFPEEFLKKWIQQGQEKIKTAEEAEKEYPSFQKSLKWSLITNQILEENNLQVSQDEIKDFAKHQVMAYMGTQSFDDAPWLDSYAENMMKDKKFIENTYYQLQADKIFGAMEQKVNVIENMVTPEELAALQHNHHHEHSD